MEPVTMIIGGLLFVVAVGTASIIKAYRELGNKQGEIDAIKKGLEAYVKEYQFEPVDIKMIGDCKECLLKMFGGDIAGKYAQLATVEEREKFTREVVRKLAKAMNVNVEDITITDLSAYTYGYVTTDDGKTGITLNRAVMIADPEQIVKTICHELRHCVQFNAMCDNRYGHSAARVALWLYSWEHYQVCESSEQYFGYRCQAVEVDANNFADSVFELLQKNK